MATRPSVSICLTTYNRAHLLPTTIESLLAQTFEDFELIISDDCSSDDTESICRNYASMDRRVRYFRNEHNLKMPGNLNAAIAKATGQYVANVHDGDMYATELIWKWKTALDEVPTASFVFNAYRVLRKDGTFEIASMPFENKVSGTEVAFYFFKTFSSCVWGTVMVRRSGYDKVGTFDHEFGFISDVDMWLRLSFRSDVAYINEPLITLTPRESNHPYAFVHWQHELWTLGIYVKHLRLYSELIPNEVEKFKSIYRGERRRLMIRNMLVCIKHARFDRVKEGFAIWADSDDAGLRIL